MLQDYSLISEKRLAQRSETFNLAEFEWFLLLFPEGDSDSRDYCSLYLHVDYDTLPKGKAVSVDYSFTIVNSDPAKAVRKGKHLQVNCINLILVRF